MPVDAAAKLEEAHCGTGASPGERKLLSSVTFCLISLRWGGKCSQFRTLRSVGPLTTTGLQAACCSVRLADCPVRFEFSLGTGGGRGKSLCLKFFVHTIRQDISLQEVLQRQMLELHFRKLCRSFFQGGAVTALALQLRVKVVGGVKEPRASRCRGAMRMGQLPPSADLAAFSPDVATRFAVGWSRTRSLSGLCF